MNTLCRGCIASIVAVLTACEVAGAQSQSVEIDLSGIVLETPFEDIVRTSIDNPAMGSDTRIAIAEGYQFSVNGQIDLDVGTFDFFPPEPGESAPLEDLLELFAPGNAGLLNGFVRAPEAGLEPGGTVIWSEGFGGDFDGVVVNITFQIEVADDGAVAVSVRDIEFPDAFDQFLFSIEFTSGSATVTTWDPSPRQVTEWRFEDGFTAVAGSDDAQLRFLDDPDFGPVLGGLAEPNVFPSPPTEDDPDFARTSEQSEFFNTADDSSVPAPGGVDAGVFRTSPAFNEADPDDSALRRGLGLALFPSLKPDYPGSFIGQWTMIWDLFIPSSSFFNDVGNPREFLLALVQQETNNDGGADFWIRNQGGETVIVQATEGNNFIQTGPLALPPAVAPDTWFRLAIVVDEFQAAETAVYVNGSLVGTIGSDFLFNLLDPTMPTFSDDEPVPQDLWETWGFFPSPWAMSMGDPSAPTRSTACLFADLRFGGSQPALLANFAFVDDLLSGDEIAALGGPSGGGIFAFGCNAADIAAPFGLLDGADVNAFISAFGSGGASADIAAPFGVLDGADVNAFISGFGAGCP